MEVKANMANFLGGVIASILAGLLLPGIRRQIIFYLQYIYQKVSGSAINLTDTWEASFTEVDKNKATLNSLEKIKIKHKAKNIIGDGEIEGPYPRKFKYHGTVFQDLVSGYYEKEGTQPGSLEGRGVFLLKINETRTKMSGFCSWFDKDSKKLEVSNYEWDRK